MLSVLIVKLGAIGDVVMVLPAAHALHERGYRVDWICGRTVLPLLELFPWINPIAVEERAVLTGGKAARARAVLGLWRHLRAKGRYDLVATLYYDRRYRLLALPVRARKRISLTPEGRAQLLPGRHHTDEYARLLLGLKDEVRPSHLAPLTPAVMLDEPRLRRPGGGPRIVLAPAGARNLLSEGLLRRWPVENYVALVERLTRSVPEVEIVLVGGMDDLWVQPLFRGYEVTDMIGALTLPESLSLLGTADVFVTHDTGPLHLAGMTQCGIVAVFGPTSPYVFLPMRPGVVGIWGGEGFACRPCYNGRDFAPCPANDCMRQVTVEMVEREIVQMLEERRRGVRQPPRVVTPDSAVRSERLVVIRGGKS